jgi:hypothetical protein
LYTLPFPCEGSILLRQACRVYVWIYPQWYMSGQLNDSNVIMKIRRIEFWVYVYTSNDIFLVTVWLYVPCDVPLSETYLHAWVVPTGKRHTYVEGNVVTAWLRELEKC